jgi:hypothetical protein
VTDRPGCGVEPGVAAIGLDAAPLDLRQRGEAVVFEALDQALELARRRFGEQRLGCGKVLATNTNPP